MEDSVDAHLWRYEPQISLENFCQYMELQKKTFPILKEFLKNVRITFILEQACICIYQGH